MLAHTDRAWAAPPAAQQQQQSAAVPQPSLVLCQGTGVRCRKQRVTPPLLLLKPSPALLLPLLPQRRLLAAMLRAGLAAVRVVCWGWLGPGVSICQSLRPCRVCSRQRHAAGFCQTRSARQERSCTCGKCNAVSCCAVLRWIMWCQVAQPVCMRQAQCDWQLAVSNNALPLDHCFIACHMVYCCLFRHLERLSSVLLECLPGFWQAAGPNKLTLPPTLPSSATALLQATMDGEHCCSLASQHTFCTCYISLCD